MSFIAAAVIAGGAALGGAYLASKGSKQAAQTSADAARDASQASLGLQREMWEQGRKDQAPWLAAGTNALAQLPSMTAQPWKPAEPWRDFTMADYKQDPGYSFRLSEGLKGLDRSAASRGGLLSGAAMKGITRYGQDYASNEYGRAESRYNANQSQRLDRYTTDQINNLSRSDVPYNRTAALAGIGQTQANSMAQNAGAYGVNAGNTAAQGINAAGQAQAAGQLGQTNAWNNGINNAVSAYQQGQLMNWLRPQTSTWANNFGGPLVGMDYNFGGGL